VVVDICQWAVAAEEEYILARYQDKHPVSMLLLCFPVNFRWSQLQFPLGASSIHIFEVALH